MHFSAPDYAKRRQNFFKALGQSAHECQDFVAIVPAHPELIRNDDVHFKFRQDSSFYYLTGFKEPDALAVFRSVGGKQEFVLFVRPKVLEKEIWTGTRAGTDQAVAKYGADRAYNVEEFDATIGELLKGTQRLYYDFSRTLARNGTELLDHKILRLSDELRVSMGRAGRGAVPIFNVRDVVGELRLFKEPVEIERLRAAGKLSAKAHSEAMAYCRPGLYEYQIEGLLEFIFKNGGSERYGYPSIVASGVNATILHYVENDQQMKDGDLLLIDAGTEIDFYTADITRTFPVNGKMTDAQKEIYSIVLDVQKECIRMVKPGIEFNSIHQFAAGALTDAMLKLNLLSGDKKTLIDAMMHRKYYPHGTSHYLGMDVHDAGLYQLNGKPRVLEPGMVFTIEPGFYVLPQDVSAAQRYRGIGVRIEDDVLVTAKGCEVLTADAPKDIADIEGLVGSKTWDF